MFILRLCPCRIFTRYIFIGMALLVLFVPSYAFAATLNIGSNDVLMGASGVEVEGKLYDVSFGFPVLSVLPTEPHTVFLQEPSTVFLDPRSPSKALSEQVFGAFQQINFPGGSATASEMLYDAVPPLTNGCSFFVTSCRVISPWALSDDGQSVWVSIFINEDGMDLDYEYFESGSSTPFVSELKVRYLSNFSGSGLSWADWRPSASAAIVPVPTAVWLFGSGLLGLIGLARRKKV